MREYLYEGKMVDKAKRLAVKIADIVPSLDHVTEWDFVVWIALEPAPRDPRTGRRTLADIRATSSNWMRGYVSYLLEKRLKHANSQSEKRRIKQMLVTDEGFPAYIITVYPQFFGLPVMTDDPEKNSRVKVLIHELHHISKTKRGVIDHIGFGDEMITIAYSGSMKKLRSLVENV